MSIPVVIKLPELLALVRRIDAEEADYSEM
jgi:hypothetical protein